MNIFSSDQLKMLLATRSVSLNINWPLSRCFCVECSETNCPDCFIYGFNCRSSKTSRRIECVEIKDFFEFFTLFLRNSLHLLRCKNYGLGTDCAHSARNLFTRGCTWLFKLIPNILNSFLTHVEPFQNFLTGTQAILRATIWSHFALLAITCPTPEKTEWKFRCTLIII